MAYKGKRITNAVNKQTIEFVTTSKDSEGKLLEMISSWEPHSPKPAEHYHPFQEEEFTVLQGQLTVRVNGKEKTLQKGDSIHIARNSVHAMWNDSTELVVVSWKVYPAGDTEYFLETAMGLASDGKVNRNGMPGLLQVSLLARRYRNEFRLSKPPYFIQKIIFLLLSPFAMLLGKRAIYPQYID